MENSGLITTSRRKYKYHYKKGLPRWAANGNTLEGYLKHLRETNKRNKTLLGLKRHRAANKRYQQKMRDLYGGQPDNNSLARARWIIAKEGLHYEKATQRP